MITSAPRLSVLRPLLQALFNTHIRYSALHFKPIFCLLNFTKLQLYVITETTRSKYVGQQVLVFQYNILDLVYTCV